MVYKENKPKKDKTNQKASKNAKIYIKIDCSFKAKLDSFCFLITEFYYIK